MSGTETGRYTPYELAFGGTEFEGTAFPAIAEESRARGLDPLRRDEFALVASAGAALQALAPEDVRPRDLGRYLDTLYHGFHFWRAGRIVYVFDEAVVRFWVEARPAVAGGTARPPHPALYVQWPRNLFWATVSEETPPEPVDGFFLVARDAVAEGRTLTEIDALMAVGVRPGRAGFATIPFRYGLDPAGVTADAGWMFRSDLPGSELAAIYALERLPEAARLVEAAFWYVDRYPDAVRRLKGAAGVERGPAAVKGPTGLDHYVVTLAPPEGGR